MRTFNNLLLAIVAIAMLFSVNVLAQSDEDSSPSGSMVLGATVVTRADGSSSVLSVTTLDDFKAILPYLSGQERIEAEFAARYFDIPKSFRVDWEYSVPTTSSDRVSCRAVLDVHISPQLPAPVFSRICRQWQADYHWSKCDSVTWYREFSTIQADGSVDSAVANGGYSMLLPYTYPDDEDGRRWFRAYVEEVLSLIDNECLEDFFPLYTSLPNDPVTSESIDYPWGRADMTVTRK